MNPADPRIRRLRAVAWLEGISYLVLLFVAMPLKYFADMPSAVRWTGLAHGLLFVVFSLNVLQAKIEQRWPKGLALRAFASAFVPLGMLWFERLLRSATIPAETDRTASAESPRRSQP